MTPSQAWFFLAVAVVSAFAAFYSVWLNRKTEKQQATLQFINDYNNDGRVSKAHKYIRQVARDDKISDDFSTSERRDNFLTLMNQFEIFAIGLKHGVACQNSGVNGLYHRIRTL